MAEAPDPHPASPSEPENLDPANVTGELQLGTSTSSVQATSASSEQSHSTGSLQAPRRPEETASRVEMPWFHTDPDITRAVISKTEEDLLSSL
ncbi:MAG TPA: hypothetical protein VGH55_04570, partial [Chthoniobacterales bacterium]